MSAVIHLSDVRAARALGALDHAGLVEVFLASPSRFVRLLHWTRGQTLERGRRLLRLAIWHLGARTVAVAMSGAGGP